MSLLSYSCDISYIYQLVPEPDLIVIFGTSIIFVNLTSIMNPFNIIFTSILSRMDPCQQPPGPGGNEDADADEEEP